MGTVGAPFIGDRTISTATNAESDTLEGVLLAVLDGELNSSTDGIDESFLGFTGVDGSETESASASGASGHGGSYSNMLRRIEFVDVAISDWLSVGRLSLLRSSIPVDLRTRIL